MLSTNQSSSLVRSIVLGAAGYSGAELAVILARNPYFELCGAYASAGRSSEPFSSLYPRYKQQLDIMVQPQPAPGETPLGMAFVAGRCKLVLSMNLPRNRVQQQSN